MTVHHLNTTERERLRRNLPSVKKVFDNVVRKEKIRFDMDKAKNTMPSIERFCYELTRYMLDFIPTLENPDRSLLAKCLVSGIEAWNQSEALNETEEVRYRKFLNGVMVFVPDVLEYAVCTAEKKGRRSNIWDPCDGPVYNWMLAMDQKQKLIVKRRERPWDGFAQNIKGVDFRALVLYKILNGRELDTLHKDVDYVLGRTELLLDSPVLAPTT